MRKKWIPHIIAVVTFVAFIVLGLASASSSSIDLRAGADESIIVVTRSDTFKGGRTVRGSIRIFIDNQEKAGVRSGDTANFVIPNGQHTIEVRASPMASQSVIFEANSQRIFFTTGIVEGFLVNSLRLAQTGVTPIR